jgi:hypothetical protein
MGRPCSSGCERLPSRSERKRRAFPPIAPDALSSRRRELGIEAALSEFEGINPPMLVALDAPPMICMAGSSNWV